jgi:hypothetical protein
MNHGISDGTGASMNQKARSVEPESAAPPDVDESLPSAGEIAHVISGWARENPRAAIASAIGIGFLVGGGLTPRIIGAVGFLAARHYFRQTVNEVLQSLVPEEIASAVGGRSRPLQH